MRYLILSLLTLLLFICACGDSADDNRITVEWIYSDTAKVIAAVHKYQWLEDNTAILFDTRLEKKERTFLKLDPQTQSELGPAVDREKALASLQEYLGKEDSTEYLEWPLSFDPYGNYAVYLYKKDIFLLDLAASEFRRLTQTETAEKAPRFSPDGSRLAFVRENDLYIYDLAANREKRLTSDGSDTILNGTVSWVYWEEIFGRRDIGYWWSEDSKALVFLQTDESAVTKMHYVDFKPAVPRLITQRYPKAGTDNPVVKVGLMEIDSPQIKWIKLEPYEYICRVKWHQDNQWFSVQTMNRAQTELNLFYIDRNTGKNLGKVLTETDTGWVNINDDLYFLESGNFLWQSERDGYAHLYQFNKNGSLVGQVTKGSWALRSSGGPFWLRQSVVNIDEEHSQVYFTSLEKSSIERHLYRIGLDGSGLQRITREEGVHKVSFSPDGKYYFDTYSNINTLPTLALYSRGGERLTMIAEPRPELLEELQLQTPELFTIPTTDGFLMPAQILKPKDFNPGKKYPLIFNIYGGPSAPTVFNRWQGLSLFFDNMLLNRGYLVVKFDHRSATAISKKLENRLLKMASGPREIVDIVDGIRWLKSQPYVDPNRVGIWGWSGGGSFTLNSMTNTREFKAGISVAPVTDWHYYDTKWAEFTMKRPQDNPEGYEKTSFVKTAKNLHGRLLLVHGTYDDNVHPQNSWHFIDELVKENIMFDMMFYPMRKHGIADDPAKIHLYNKMLEFWQEYL
ncbi:MAG: DPP IV N-terminal domain-containing protein [Candidatus Marinimicrobia bacterium]|jgi:dipeptidyl-peptidase-4|nr:DPP IV N-terminal domain-containing protein [Candidatus Neomarinimicrobiota bacterium]MDP6615453.1 DPP IV N-terminal domain-containing protein [Candidatus Neomarinimicrobiota bacterium]